MTARFLRWLFSWRTIRRFLIGLAWMATIIALFYGEENWRGRRAWNKYRQELEARGEQMDYRAFIPKPIPDEKNFAATPFIQSLFLRNGYGYDEDNYSAAGPRISGPETDKGDRHFKDLTAWSAAFAAAQSGDLKLRPKIRRPSFQEAHFDLESRAKAAPAVLEGLKSSEAVFAELRAASQRPSSRYPVTYDLENPWGILLPHLAMIKGTCQRLLLKACADLAIDQSEPALEDVKLILRLADSLKEEPFLISYRVRLACVALASQPIWEGLAEHRWNEDQLLQLQSRLQEQNYLADLKRPLDAERAAEILTVELVRKKGLGYLNELGGEGLRDPSEKQILNLLSPMVPSGWYCMEQLEFCRLFQIQLAGAFDPIQRRVSPSRAESATRDVEHTMAEDGAAGKILHHHVFASILRLNLTDVISSAAKAQACSDEAALACALERFRLANKQFPENLEALKPRFIAAFSHDVFTGDLYKYRRPADGQFVLYSIGWNEKDDGGVPGNVLFDEKKGDWIWRYPSK